MTTRKRGQHAPEISDQAVIEAYEELGSVHKAGERLGVSPQTVHNRLTRLGICQKTRAIIDEYRNTAGVTEIEAKFAVKQFLICLRNIILRGDRAILAGIGEFKVRTRKPSKGINTATEDMKWLTFRANRKIKSELNHHTGTL